MLKRKICQFETKLMYNVAVFKKEISQFKPNPRMHSLR